VHAPAAGRIEAAGLDGVLAEGVAFRPYPPASDHAAWERLVPEDRRRAFVAAAEKQLEKPWAVLGLQTDQVPGTFLVGSPKLASSTPNCRIPGKFTLLMSSGRLQPPKLKAMFDCPLHTQTSPTTTLQQ
jgi:hypothetical protein